MNVYLKVKFNYLIALVAICILFGCQMKDEKTKVSTDLAAFNNLFAIDIALKSISWELFNTPEYTGGIPGPTDYVTLIAQIEASNDEKFDRRPTAGTVWIAPESSRSWLNTEFRDFLEKSKNTTIDLSKKGNCRALTGVLKKTSKTIDGFACKSGTKILIYLTVLDYTLQAN